MMDLGHVATLRLIETLLKKEIKVPKPQIRAMQTQTEYPKGLRVQAPTRTCVLSLLMAKTKQKLSVKSNSVKVVQYHKGLRPKGLRVLLRKKKMLITFLEHLRRTFHLTKANL